MRLIYIIPLIIIVILNIVFYYNVKTPKTNNNIVELVKENQLPKFTLQILESSCKFSDKDLPKGEYFIMNFFASWCESCKYEHKILEKIAKDSNIKIYGIMVRDEEARTKKFLDDLGNPYQLVASDKASRFSISLGITTLPETILVKDNVIVVKLKGPLTQEIYEQKIKSYL